MTSVLLKENSETQGEDSEKAQGVDGHLEAKGKGLEQILPTEPQKKPTLLIP